jgi:uncharacterized damage-inducible protein DinB
MADTPEGLSERLLREGEKVLAFFQDLDSERFERPVYSEGADWSVREVLAHFVSTEKAFSSLLENVLGGGSGAPEGFDIDAYNQRKVAALKDMAVQDLLVEFQEQRLRTAESVANLDVEQLQRMARHPFLGVAPLVDIIKLIYRHNQIHLRDVRRITGVN